jgi:hypothetical protein
MKTTKMTEEKFDELKKRLQDGFEELRVAATAGDEKAQAVLLEAALMSYPFMVELEANPETDPKLRAHAREAIDRIDRLMLKILYAN